MAKAKTWEQHKAECEAVAKPGVTILGYVGEWNGIRNKILCNCVLHGNWTIGMSSFKQGKGCAKCGKLRTAQARSISWEECKVECDKIAKPGITVLGYVGKWRGDKTKLRCSCAVHGIWETTIISNFKQGASCRECYNETVRDRKSKDTEQHIADCQAVCPNGITIHGWIGKWEGNTTKLHATCEIHGEWTSTSIAGFKRGQNCPKCGVAKARENSKKEDESFIDIFLGTGVFTPGTIFSRSEKTDKRGHHSYWDVYCPKCATDEFSQLGLCSGTFQSIVSSLKKGLLPCRCSIKPHYTPEQNTHRAKTICLKHGYTFIAWEGSITTFSKFSYLCSLHGEKTSTLNNMLQGRGCAECAGYSQQQCYVNIVKDGDLFVALKVGIAKDSNIRLNRQNKTNLFQMEQVSVYEFPTVESCKAAERACLSELNCGVLGVRELKDGWTETVALTDYDKVVSIYERFGGVRVDTLTEEE